MRLRGDDMQFGLIPIGEHTHGLNLAATQTLADSTHYHSCSKKNGDLPGG